MSQKRILLTGGTGFFGKWLLKQRPEDAKICVLSRDPEAFMKAFPVQGIEFIQGDVRSFEAAGRFDCVIHAATAFTGDIPEHELESIIVEGTRRVLELDFGKMLYVSSGAVYGRTPPEGVTEDCPVAPEDVYGRSKLTAEHLCLQSGKDIAIARCFAFVGPYLPLDAHFAIGNFIQDCLQNRDIVIRGDGTPRRSYLYMADLAEWLWAMLYRGEAGRVYNVGSDAAYSIREVAELLRRAAGSDNAIRVLAPPSERTPVSYVPGIGRAKQELNLSVTVPLEEAIRRTLEFYAETMR